MQYTQLGLQLFRLDSDYVVSTGILPPYGMVVCRPFAKLSGNGELTVLKGYEWDGATGAIDTSDFIRPSMIHDIFCLFVEEKVLPVEYRKKADKLLRKLCLEDGMSKIRAAWVYAAVRAYALLKYKQ